MNFRAGVFAKSLAGLAHLPELFTIKIGDNAFPIIWSIIGSALFVAVLSFLTARGRPQQP